MTTARDIIQSAVEEIGEYAPGEPMTDADAERCLTVLNDMLAMWSNESLACFAHLEQSFSTVNGQSAYTVGPTGVAVSGTRPLKIEHAWRLDSGGFQEQLDPLPRQEWDMLNHVPTSIPTCFFYDPQVPNGSLKLWPTPNAVFTIGFVSYLQLTAFANLSTVVVLPRGYEGALKKSLAIEIAPFFDKTPLAVTVALAAQYKGQLKVTNMEADVLQLDPAILSRFGNSSIFNG